MEEALNRRMGSWRPGLARFYDTLTLYGRYIRRSFPVMREVEEAEVEQFREDSKRRADFELWKKQRLYEQQQERRQHDEHPK